jgi:hypothetical protein
VEFRTDEAQLLGLWAATRLLGEIRDLEDPMARAELFTKAQVLLTAFVLGLEPLNSDRTISASPRAVCPLVNLPSIKRAGPTALSPDPAENLILFSHLAIQGACSNLPR